MTCAGYPSKFFFVLGLEDVHVPTFWLPFLPPHLRMLDPLPGDDRPGRQFFCLGENRGGNRGGTGAWGSRRHVRLLVAELLGPQTLTFQSWQTFVHIHMYIYIYTNICTHV